MSDKEKKISITLFVLAIVFTIMGSTLAYWNWQTGLNDQTNVTFRVTSDFSCGADGGGSITSQEKILAPTTCTNENYAFQRPITVKPTINKNGKTIYMDLYLQVNQIGTYLAQTPYFKYALTTEPDSCTSGVIASGSFQGTTTGSKVYLFSDKTYSSTTNDPYYLYIWLDKDETDNNTQNQPFNISLGGTCTDEAPTTFTGTIYRYSDVSVSIGDPIVPTVVNKWCDVENDSGTVYDCFDLENECNQFLQDNNYTETDTCTYGVTKPGLTSYETNASNLNKTFYLKHTIVNDIVTESYVEFVVTPTMAQANSGMKAGTYYLKGGDNGAAYTTNKATLTTAFGSGNCTDNSSDFACSVSGLRAYAYSDGGVRAAVVAGAACSVGIDGASTCRL